MVRAETHACPACRLTMSKLTYQFFFVVVCVVGRERRSRRQSLRLAQLKYPVSPRWGHLSTGRHANTTVSTRLCRSHYGLRWVKQKLDGNRQQTNRNNISSNNNSNNDAQQQHMFGLNLPRRNYYRACQVPCCWTDYKFFFPTSKVDWNTKWTSFRTLVYIEDDRTTENSSIWIQQNYRKLFLPNTVTVHWHRYLLLILFKDPDAENKSNTQSSTHSKCRVSNDK